MCIIIDACCANSLSAGSLPQGKLLLEWVKAGGKVVSGGQLEAELKGTSLQALLAVWSSSGRLVALDKDKVSREERKVKKSNIKSNDAHIIALARLSDAGVVVTRDKLLMHDLKKSGEVTPPCKIYPFGEKAVTDLRVHRGVLRNANCK